MKEKIFVRSVAVEEGPIYYEVGMIFEDGEYKGSIHAAYDSKSPNPYEGFLKERERVLQEAKNYEKETGSIKEEKDASKEEGSNSDKSVS